MQKSKLANGAATRMGQSSKQYQANRGRQSDDGHLKYPPAAPEVPRGPSVPYRQSHGGDSGGQSSAMSFSQRAKGQMLVQDALEDSDYSDEDEDVLSKTRTPEDNGQNMGGSHPKWFSQKGAIAPHNERELQGDSFQRRSDVPSSESPQSTPRASRPIPHGLRHSTDVAPLKLDVPSSSAQSKPTRGSANLSDAQAREWAPDRSPLQTLEVKLNDISKEEKRARVEEAEMLLRESKAGRGGGPSRDVQPASKRSISTKEPTRKKISPDGPGFDRSSSSTQLNPLHRRSHNESYTPDGRFPPSEDRSALGHPEQKVSERPVADQMPRSQDLSRSQRQDSRDGGQMHPAHDRHGTAASAKSGRGTFRDMENVVQGHPVREPHFVDAIEPVPDEFAPPQKGISAQNKGRRATSSRQAPLAQSIPSNITRAVSLQQHQPQPFFPEDDETSRSGPMRETNSSHRAALAEATAGVGAAGAIVATSIKRDNSRKLQKAPPANLNRSSYSEREKSNNFTEDGTQQVFTSAEAPQLSTNTSNQDHKAEFYYRGMPKHVDVNRSNSQQAADPVGLSLKEPGVVEQNNAASRPQQTSVSFRVPFGKARPVNEWKHAGTARLTLADLALDSPGERNQAWWEMNGSSSRRRSNRSSGEAQVYKAQGQQRHTDVAEFQPRLYLKCGPLLRYTGMRRDRAERQPGQTNSSIDRETWRGSVMIVTHDSQSSYEKVPTLRIFSQPKDLLPPPPQQVQGDDLAPEYVDPIAGLTKVSRHGQVLYVKPVDHVEEGHDLSRVENDDGLFETSPSPLDDGVHGSAIPNKRTWGRDGESLGRYREVKGVRIYADIDRDVTFWRFNIEVELGAQQAHIAYRINHGPPVGFWVPAKGQTMNIMFHSCNGFSLSVNADEFSGPDPLWRDVLNTHQTRPFHVMIGGGDQVYNDRVMVDTDHFATWTQLRNSHEKSHAPLNEEMREELETFYLDRYAMWFSQGLFGLANSQIPMVNIYDDHDIVDGFGSYPDDFQRSPVFMGIGNIAFKYYMLFQHQSVPEETQADEPSWLLGAKPGPYIQQLSRSVFLNLGQSVAFLGLDCRTERERYSVLTDDTYDLVLDRCRREIIEGETTHLLVLLGVPVAYPRLVWLENLLTSRAMTPVKALGRAGIFRGAFLNKFDGGVEVLDDLDDHWTASGHKQERNNLIHDLQELAAEKSIRITILGGDVHLGAVGQFYSDPKLQIPKDRDHRYIPNVISSAIANTPPPEMLADTLNKRNKVHHLDPYTVEDMIPMFTHDVDGKKRNNKRLLPRRNWCSIREYHPGSTPPSTPPESITPSDQLSESEDHPPPARRRFSFSRQDARPGKLLHRLSQRGAPPSSYRDDMNITSPTAVRRASHDGYFPNPQEPQTAPPTRTSFPMDNRNSQVQPQTAPPHRTSFNSMATASYNNRASIDAIPSGPNPRPGIFRRPTSLSEKAAKKGGGAATDSEGNLLQDLNDHIDLDGGLDITLNCEVTQGDPAGITTPYRLLVPALRYDGSSDSQKLNDPGTTGGGVQRKPTLLKKLGFGRTGDRSMADRQGQGNWGQESESGNETLSESQYSDEDDDDYYRKEDASPGGGLKRWFSGRRGTGKQERRYSSPEYDHSEMPLQRQLRQKGGQPADDFAVREPRTAPASYQQKPPHSSSQNTSTNTTSPSPRALDQPPSESFPSHARGKAAQVMGMGMDQGPLSRSSSQYTPQDTQSHPATSLNQSQPLPPLSPQAGPAQQQSPENGINRRGSARYYENYNLSPPGLGPQSRRRGRGTETDDALQASERGQEYGYTGLEAYPGKKKNVLKKWF